VYFRQRSSFYCNREDRKYFCLDMDKVTTIIIEHARAAEQHRRRAALRAVASLELAKGLIVLLLGFGAVSLVHKDAWDVAEAVLRFLHVNPDHHRSAQVFLNLADNVTDKKLWLVAAGAAAYSIVRFIEAYGLWRARTWAEWFALISGALYVPFEAYELVRRTTPIHVAVLLINLAIVFYMLYLRLTARKEAMEEGAQVPSQG
jgi:uncharacterized membrane protein (DUF2068 family)